jgi:hypothetical protein
MMVRSVVGEELMPHRNNQSQIESGVPAETDGIVED